MNLLVFRMSSLGDLILSTSFLENLPKDAKVDWVVASEFKFVLEGHPKIRRLFVFEKKTGLRGWFRLISELASVPYDARVDLHVTLRSRIAFAYFLISDLFRFKFLPRFSISKERLRTNAYFLFKRLLPKALRPTPYWKRFGLLAHQISHFSKTAVLLPPNYLPLLGAPHFDEAAILSGYGLRQNEYFTVMPASRWESKQWGVEKYFELIQKITKSKLAPVLMGRKTDPACVRLEQLLKEAQIEYRSALSESDFKKSAVLLKNAKFYLGSDTGLAHLSEAVGVKCYILFGPTRRDLGFGPWREGSRGIQHEVLCSPCSKDGRHCFRIFDSYACLRKLGVAEVERELK